MNTLGLALQITALGMGLVFAAIILLWGMMNLLTAITADKAEGTGAGRREPDETHAAPKMESDLRAHAAAVAVAVALTEIHGSSAHPLSDPPTAVVSAWTLGMRTRQMYQKGGSFRRRAR